VEVAKRLVPEHSPINLGVNGYTSFQGYKALLKYGDLVKPNIVFIAFNYNDRRFAQEADSDAVFRALGRYGSIRDLGESIYLFRVAAFLHRRLGGAGLDSLDIMPEVRLDRVRPRVDPGGYRENLTMMVQWARQRRIPVVFVLFGDNPNATYVLRQGIKYLSEKRYELAIKLLRQARDHPLSQFVALAGLYLSRAYSEAGLKGEAQDALALKNVRSSLHGIYPILLDSEYHEIAREVAGKFGIQVIDAASELNKTPNVYFDFAHFDPEGHEIVGRLVADVIKGAQMNSAGGKP
jgi:lysophospholipase L1-like esterase